MENAISYSEERKEAARGAASLRHLLYKEYVSKKQKANQTFGG
ncbi:hypothetical protein [Ralstonia edaphi]|nr:hypothetical protein [Ralstonia sp. LMG 6871]